MSETEPLVAGNAEKSLPLGGIKVKVVVVIITSVRITKNGRSTKDITININQENSAVH